jgi:hypothetical protein
MTAMRAGAFAKRLRRRHVSGHLPGLAAGTVCVALLASGCGGGSKAPSVASLGATSVTNRSTSTTGSSLPPRSPAGGPRVVFSGVGIAFAACMRRRGAPNVPDPDVQGQLSITGIDPRSPQFRSAEKDCEKFIPNQPPVAPAQRARAQAQALRFAACMRSHGVPSFPDPTFSGGNIGQRGIDSSSPQFRVADTACAARSPFPG